LLRKPMLSSVVRYSFGSLSRNAFILGSRIKFKSNMSTLRENIVFLDLEMSGLEVTKDKILEIGCVITDPDLKQIAEPLHIIINQPVEVLENMDDWCKENLKELRLECEKSEVSERMAEEMLLEYLKKHVKEKTCPLAGNTIWMDRAFLRHHFPKADNYLHYRIIDVSS
jgi:oligoribonuclease